MKYEHFIWRLIQICWKKWSSEVERHRLSDLSRVTKLVSVRARARSQPTYPVISHHHRVAKGGVRRERARARGGGWVRWGATWGEGEKVNVSVSCQALLWLYSKQKKVPWLLHLLDLTFTVSPSRQRLLVGRRLSWTSLCHSGLHDPRQGIAWLTYMTRLYLFSNHWSLISLVQIQTDFWSSSVFLVSPALEYKNTLTQNLARILSRALKRICPIPSPTDPSDNQALEQVFENGSHLLYSSSWEDSLGQELGRWRKELEVIQSWFQM